MKNAEGIEVPNPGSKEAGDLGCTCAVLDNHHGAGFPWGGEISFWITENCPVHGIIGLHPKETDGQSS
jgi:hypothetical protein